MKKLKVMARSPAWGLVALTLIVVTSAQAFALVVLVLGLFALGRWAFLCLDVQVRQRFQCMAGPPVQKLLAGVGTLSVVGLLMSIPMNSKLAFSVFVVLAILAAIGILVSAIVDDPVERS